MAFHDPHTPSRDDFTQDEAPGWTTKEVEALSRIPHDERLKAALDARDAKKSGQQIIDDAITELQRLGQEHDAAPANDEGEAA